MRKGRFSAKEDAKYLELLNKFGKPTQNKREFLKAFPDRKMAKMVGHITSFKYDSASQTWCKYDQRTGCLLVEGQVRLRGDRGFPGAKSD